jgi:hypothetical protein
MNDNIENEYKYNILRAALDIKMAVDGSYGIEAEYVKEIVDYLQYRIDNWRPSNTDERDIFIKRARFDSLVKQLCQESLSYYKGSWIESILKERESK